MHVGRVFLAIPAIPAIPALLLFAAALLGCARDSVPVARGSAPSAAVAATTPAEARGRVRVQGRPAAGDVEIRVARISDEVTAETVVEGLEVPWALAFTPDGRILVTERRGRIRLVRDGALQPEPFATLAVTSVSESGLMGLALHPDFARNGHLFVCYTYENSDGRLRNRVARLTDAGGVGVDHQVILDDIPAARNHNGCRIRFGPDARLYVTMGDAQDGNRAQDLDSLSGKVLRLEADGSVPADNPFPGSYVYTYGHRNPQGIDWHPETGDLFITEHGPNENDEINLLEPGGNYGWPEVTGVRRDPRYVDPILTFTPTVALSGGAFYTGTRLADSWQGNFLFTTLKASHLHRVILEPPDFRAVQSHQRLFSGQFGRLRAAALGPDGYLYFTTSNRDGRGSPNRGDDRILRLIPAPSGPPEVSHPGPDGSFALKLEPGTYNLSWSLPGFLTVETRVVAPGEAGINLPDITLRAGDLDGDGAIGQPDLDRLAAVFGLPATPDIGNTGADFNADGAIDVLDLSLLASNWGLGR